MALRLLRFPVVYFDGLGLPLSQRFGLGRCLWLMLVRCSLYLMALLAVILFFFFKKKKNVWCRFKLLRGYLAKKPV